MLKCQYGNVSVSQFSLRVFLLCSCICSVALVFTRAEGATENAGAANSARSKMQGWKTRHQNACFLACVYQELNSL